MINMKIAIITDQHFGCRKNSELFHDYFLKFYNDIFFPTIEEEGIKTIIDMGDTFDSVKVLTLLLLHGQKIITMIVLQKWDVKFIP
ncbi:MAG: hypothetical protein CM15mV12_0820 [uncultured marine virus]|nr:MAG: hypothetical protein CM15mV12_0820 [uncultured marine virus]